MSSKGKASSSSAGDPSVPKVKAACEECRLRKTKCDGIRPTCGRCQRKSIPCVYETEPDEFRITALKRRYAELAQSSADNEALLDLLRQKSRPQALEILDRIRNHDSVASILADGGNRPDVDAERSLMSAVETARSSEGEASLSSSGGSGQGEAVQSREAHPSTADDRHSIAFLVGESGAEEPAGSATPLPSVRPSSPSHRDTSQPQQSAEKRARVDSPETRPNLPGPATSAPIPIRTSAERMLSTKPKTQDKSWLKRFSSIKASEFEVYYTDDETFLEILCCYFTWENPVSGLVPEEAFWEGLISRGSDFCNRMLVHSVLAFGVKIFSMFYPDRAASAGHFALLEARKAWDWDADAAVPANISAGLLVHATLTANGLERDGEVYLTGAMNLLLKSGLLSEERVGQVYPQSDLELSRTRAAFAWCMHSYHGYITLTLRREISISAPPIAIPEPNSEEDSRDWTPHPLVGPARAGLTSTKNYAKAGLWLIGRDVLGLHKRHEHESRSQSHWNDALAAHSKLDRWYSDLNSRLGNLHGAPMHVFALHMDYYRIVLELMKPFTTIVGPQGVRNEANRICEHSQTQLRFLVQQMDLQYDDLPISLNLLLGPLVTVANELLSQISTAGELSDEAFYFNLCIKKMRRMAAPYLIMHFLILGFHQMASRQGFVLPTEAQETVDTLASTRRMSLPGSTSPSFIPDLSVEKFEASNLASLIGDTARLNLERGSSGR